MRLRLSLLAIALLAPATALAEEPSAAAPAAAVPTGDAPSAAPVVTTTPVVAPDATPPAATATTAAPAKGWKDLLVIEGLADSYYQWNFTGQANGNHTTGPALRNFDNNANSFTLNYAKVGIGLAAEKAGFRLDLGYGATGAVINAAAPPGEMGVAPPNTAGTAFLVQQAYATLTPVDGLSIDFGKFVTTAGAEVIESNKNWLYSRSFLFFNIPLLHNGVRAGYKINDMFSAQLSLVNGWNGTGIPTYITGDKTVGLNVAVNVAGASIIPTVYVGDTGSGTVRTLFDLVAAYSIGQLALNLNFDYLHDKNALPDDFWGVALMGHYTISDMINATARGEFAQTNNAMGVRYNYWEITAGVALPFSGHYEIRPELRYDGADLEVFNGKKSQVTATVAALAYF
jgi:hypothetical protein